MNAPRRRPSRFEDLFFYIVTAVLLLALVGCLVGSLVAAFTSNACIR